MNLATAGLELADLIIAITDPKATKWYKEQLEINARAKAKAFIKNLENQR